MSDIHINRAGQSVGIFTEVEVQVGLNNGRFVGTDLAWRTGMENWKPLAQWSDMTIPAIPPVPVSAALIPTGTQDLPSWEQRGSMGFFSAFGNTIKEVLTEPAATFSRMKETGGFMVPFFFMVLSVGLGVAFSLLIQFGMQGALSSMAASQNPEIAKAMALQGVGVIGLMLILFVVLPLALFVSSFISAGFWHVSLMVLGGANKSYEATYRVYCYATGAASLVSLVPCCGAPAAFIWKIVSGAIGLSKVHQISTGKAVLAILLPLILCCSVMAVGIFTLYQSLVHNPDVQAAFSNAFNHH